MSVTRAKATASAPVNGDYKSGTARVRDKYSSGQVRPSHWPRHCTALRSTALHCTVPCCTALCYTVLHGTMGYTVSHSIPGRRSCKYCNTSYTVIIPGAGLVRLLERTSVQPPRRQVCPMPRQCRMVIDRLSCRFSVRTSVRSSVKTCTSPLELWGVVGVRSFCSPQKLGMEGCTAPHSSSG